MPHKIPVSVLVVIHTQDLRVLMMERADHPGLWQSVTGSRDASGESLSETARREVLEETGIDAARHQLLDWHHRIEYEIDPRWRHRYAPGVLRNIEHWFGLRVSGPMPIRLSPREHVRAEWLPCRQAAARCFSLSNREAILQLPARSAMPAFDTASAGKRA